MAVLRWSVELAALGKITGWYKRDLEASEGFIHIHVGGISVLLIDLEDTISASLVKRDGETIGFAIGNESFHYKPQMIDDIFVGNANLALLQGKVNSNKFPVAMLEANDNGTWILNVLDLDDINRRDGVDELRYVTGTGSMVIECQYGAGSEVSDSDINRYENLMGELQGYSALTRATYNFYHGYIGSDSRLKCATKLYSTDENFSRWRNWDDVWSSF